MSNFRDVERVVHVVLDLCCRCPLIISNTLPSHLEPLRNPLLSQIHKNDTLFQPWKLYILKQKNYTNRYIHKLFLQALMIIHHYYTMFHSDRYQKLYQCTLPIDMEVPKSDPKSSKSLVHVFLKPVTWGSPLPDQLPTGTCSSADGRAHGNGQAEGEERRQHADGRTDHGSSLRFVDGYYWILYNGCSWLPTCYVSGY